MKIRALGMFMGAAGAALIASTAMADPFTFPDATDVKLKLTDAGNLYPHAGPDGAPVAAPRGDAFPVELLNANNEWIQPDAQDFFDDNVVGSRDFTAFTITSYSLDNNPAFTPVGTTRLTGVATFLKVNSVGLVDGDASNGDPALLRLRLGDHSSATRGESNAITGYIGRYFLFDTTGETDAGIFNTSGGLPGDVQWFDGAGAGATISSNGIDFFDIDLLDNFTIGTAGAATVDNRLVLTGSFKANASGLLTDLLTQKTDITGVTFSGLISDNLLSIDGGYWVDIGQLSKTADTGNTASFKINQTGYTEDWNGLSGASSNYPGVGDQNVFEGNWQIASEDPIQFTTGTRDHGIPEPATAGLSILGLGALAGFITRRRSR